MEDKPSMEGENSLEDSTSTAGIASTKVNGHTNDNEQRPSDLLQPSSKKRRSNIQLNKDACNSHDNGDLNDDEGSLSEPLRRAPEDVLQKRNIIKANTKWSNAGGGTTVASGGAFASVKLAPTASVNSGDNCGGQGDRRDRDDDAETRPSNNPRFFGLGFGSAVVKPGEHGLGFGNSHGFGALKSSSPSIQKNSNKVDTNSLSKPTAFGGGFAVSSRFGSLKSSTPTFAFGSTDTANNTTSSSNNGVTVGSASGLAGKFATSTSKSCNTGQPTFPTSSVVDTANGEQDEDCLCQVRAKLFKMVPEDESPPVKINSPSKGDVLSVPSSSGRMDLAKLKNDNKEGSSEKVNKTPEEANEPSTLGADEHKPKLVQKEAGLGPVRVLRRKCPMMLASVGEEAAKMPASARVVQRQETSGGQATKVTLNIRLDPKTCKVIRRSENYVQLNAPNSDGKLEPSLFKVKTSAEADTLVMKLKSILDAGG